MINIFNKYKDVLQRKISHGFFPKELAEDSAPPTKSVLEKQLYHLLEQAPPAILLLDGPDFIVELANEKALEIIGRTREEALGKKLGDVLPELELQGFKKLMQMVYSTGQGYTAEEAPVTFKRNGERIDTWIKFVFQPLKDETGRVTGLMITGDDIGTQILARKKIEESENRFRSMANEAPLFVWVTDEKLQTTFLNKTGLDYFNLESNTDISALSWKKFIHPDDLPMVVSTMEEAGRNHQPYTLEMRLKDEKTGIYRWFLDKGTGRYTEGQLTGFIGTSLDIHDRKESENRIRQNEKQLQLLSEELELKVALRTQELQNQNLFIQTLLDSSTDFVIVIDKELRHVNLNKKAREAYKKHFPEDVIGKRIDEVNPKLYESGGYQDLLKTFEGNAISRAEVKSRTEDIYYDIDYIPISDENEVYAVMCVVRDVTQNVLAKKEIIETNEQLRKRNVFIETIIESSHEWISVWDTNMRILSINQHAAAAAGKTQDQMIGKSLLELYPDAIETKSETDLRRAINGEFINNEPFYSVLSKRWVRNYLTPLRDNDGSVYAVLAIANDVTDFIQVNQELEQSNKELESFNYIASHDLQEPLRKIQTFISLMQKDTNGTALEKYVNKINESSQRMSMLIKDVLDYSRLSQKAAYFQLTDLNHILELVKADLELIIAEKNAVILSDPLPVIYAAPLQMQQLFNNIISNALKFSDKQPEIRITATMIGPDQINQITTNKKQPFIEIKFTDNGIGFDPKYKEQIFQLFQRLHTKSQYSGTGVGLSIVKKIVDQHKGFIQVDSSEGNGTTFTLWFPME